MSRRAREGDPREAETISEPPRPPKARAAAIARGTLIDGQYRVVSALGTGGMGHVLLAHDEQLDRDVAVKVVHPELVELPEARAAFVSEARAMARLVHPNVVGVYAVGELDGAPYLVMEHIPGRSLGALLKEREGPLGIDEAAFVLDQVCRGLAAIHAAGLVHRDLKPANVLIGPGFRVAIGDLGIAQPASEAARDARVTSGTPSYMAPEVRLGAGSTPELAPRADVYSLGVMAYQLLTGRLPYRQARIGGLTEPPPASGENTKLPAAVDRVLARALTLFPDQRTHGADAFRRELLAALEERATRPRSPGRVLVADDDPMYRDLTRLMLARAFPGATIEAAPDGKTALAAAEHLWPDLVVTDLDMPGLDGAALTRALRARPRGETLPIVVASAVAGATDWRLLCRLDADGFLTKPFEPAQLIALARAVLERRRATRAACS